MTPIPETPMPEEQNGQPLDESIPPAVEAEQPTEETLAEAAAFEEVEQPVVEEKREGEASEEIRTEPVESIEEESSPKPPGKFQLLLRKVGIWALITLAVFAVFGLLVYFQIYRPVKQNAAVLEGQLADVQAELAVSQDALAAAEEETAEVEAMLEISEARVALYQTLNGITAARAALDKKDGQDALKALKKAQTAMADLLPTVRQDSPEAAEQMDTRLKAAISSLSGDFKTTKADLETLTALLMQQDKLLLEE
ncbi:MAG: hypothetical protein RBT34_05805 [Anaerolineaceae bacterium]|jgi:hypothetical protein|nr:hypothetical protein [Anaerolineaceae bacterium]